MRIALNPRSQVPNPKSESAFILPVVLVIFMLLGMLAIAFSFSTRAESAALNAQVNLDQARNCAMSGIEAAALLLREKYAEQEVWFSDPKLFKDVPVEVITDRDKRQTFWRYSLVAPDPDSDAIIRYGITDEAGKLNINVASKEQLERLPGMTAEMVANLLEWREKGDRPKYGGAKDAYYMNLPQPYRCKKAPLDTVEELLLVKGFTAKVLFGEDMNRNGILDPNEDDGKKSLPIDNADGTLDRGLYPYITVYSKEQDVTDSDPYCIRYDTRWGVMPMVWDKIIGNKLDKLGSERISFIKGALGKIKRTPAEFLTLENSPFKDNPEGIDTVMDLFTCGYKVYSKDGYVYGRINVNTASKTVLATIGKLDAAEIDAIISTRARLDASALRSTAWLVLQRALTPEKYAQVAYLLTARSFQFTVESVGYAGRDTLQSRLQAVLELRLPRVQYIYWRDLTSLGRAYNIGDFGDEKIAVKK